MAAAAGLQHPSKPRETFFARRRFLTNLIIPILPELKYKGDYPNYSPPMKSFVLCGEFFNKETPAGDDEQSLQFENESLLSCIGILASCVSVCVADTAIRL